MPEPSTSQSTSRTTKVAEIEELIATTATPKPIPGDLAARDRSGRRPGPLEQAVADALMGPLEQAPRAPAGPAEEIVVDVDVDANVDANESRLTTSTPGIRRSWLDVALAEKLLERRTEPIHLSPGAIVPGTRYRIVRWIGDGGMGVVYEAEHMDIGRRFAVKILRQEVCNIPRATQLFRDEARAAAKIGADAIVEIFDFAELPDGRLLYAMELLNGRALAREIAERPLAPARVVAILRQLCKGLAAAHAAHIIHRDIKPDNIFLAERNGRPDAVKILDFGIAIFMVEATVTDANVIGTPHYLAPEIVTGKPYDARVDMYAIGCTAFEMLTGQPPFEGSMKELLEAHVDRPPPSIAEVRADDLVPAALEAVLRRCMAKDPDARFADMEDLEAALCEAQIAAKLETPWDDLPLPNVDVERRDKLLRRMPDPNAGALAQGPRRRPYLAWLAIAALAIAAIAYVSNALINPSAVEIDPRLVRLEAEAREAAARVIFVYPPASAPDARTAYQAIRDMETLTPGPKGDNARALARELRRE
ncbi:MAG: serine/threonine protein kinase, partial [Myxococcales bacterium]|nr:serine/threonine protein kinase [Myxococcales bacterium]